MPKERSFTAHVRHLRLLGRVALIVAAGFVAWTTVDVIDGIRCYAEGGCYDTGLWYAWELFAALLPATAGLVLLGRVRTLDALAAGTPERRDRSRTWKNRWRTPVTGSGLLALTLVSVAIHLVLQNFAFHQVAHPGRERAYLAAMKSDLRNVGAAQEIYFSESGGAYARDLGALGATESEGVHVEMVLTADGYMALARHEAVELTCALYVGSTRRPPATEPGVVECESLRRGR